MKANVVHQGDAEFRDLGGGVERRVLAYTPQMMIAEVRFKAGGEGSAHTHPHAHAYPYAYAHTGAHPHAGADHRRDAGFRHVRFLF